jgi:XTP/dITP diphosphohydrolase
MPEEGDDYRENALRKAVTVARATGLPTLADDSGLEVAALGGAPGPRSARYGGPDLDDAGRVRRLLAELAATGDPNRSARFVCVAALALASGASFTAFGSCPGSLLAAPRGTGGFGYDPIFQPEGHTVSMAELPAERKNVISHRARSLAALEPDLRRALGLGTAAP